MKGNIYTMHIFNVIEAACDSDLLLESEKEKRYFAFDTVELTRGDFTSRMNGYAVALDKNVMQLDEVREREDLPPLGFNFIKLGLQDVLLDVKTNRIYTPNTNKFQDLGDMTPDTNQTVRMGEIENNLENSLPGGLKDDIIKSEERAGGNPYHAKDGKFTFGKVRMSKSEYNRVSSGILTDHPNLKNDGKNYDYFYGNCYYVFNVIEPGTYAFIGKLDISDKNMAKIDFIKENYINDKK